MSKAWTFASIAPVETPQPTDGYAPSGKNSWKQSLFGCFNSCEMTLCVLCCQPCTIGQVASIARKGAGWLCLLTAIGILALNVASYGLDYYFADSDQSQGWVLTVASVFGLLASLIAFLCVWNARAKYRERDDLNGGFFTDCLAALCCAPCAVCQMFAQDDIGAGRRYKQFWSTYGDGLEPEEPAEPAGPAGPAGAV